MRKADGATDDFYGYTAYRSRTIMSRLFLIISFALILAGCARTTADNDFPPAQQQFPEFKLDAIDGSRLGSKSLTGKVVLINFWASWCGPCRMETPSLVELKTEYQERGFEIVGIAIDPEDKDDIHKFVREFNVNYPVLYSDQKIERQAGLIGTPTSFLLDRDGAIVRKHLGMVTKETLESEIESLLSEK